MSNDINRSIRVEPLATVLADAKKTRYSPTIISVLSETSTDLAGVRFAIVDRYGGRIESPTLNVKTLIACIESIWECRKALASALCYAEKDTAFADSDEAKELDAAYKRLPLH